MNVLILGSGGREHALARSIASSPLCTALYCAPGNPGTATLAQNIDLDPSRAAEVAAVLDRYAIDLIVVGPEQYLVEGLRDQLEAFGALQNRIFFGPGAQGAQLEGSKQFSKEFMLRHGIPTARAAYFESGQEGVAIAYLKKLTGPYVLKADGLAAGKGVVIATQLEEAERELRELLGGRFGQASKTVLIEDFLDGREFSVFALTDGKRYLLLPEARDYKRVGEGNTGPNTGGMGSISPVDYVDREMWRKVEERIVLPTIRGLEADGIDYLGFVFFGLIECQGEPWVIEYNVRMGDPETQSVLHRLQSDLLRHMVELSRSEPLSPVQTDPRAAATVVLCSEGYPLSARKGDVIVGLDAPAEAVVYHSGTRAEQNQTVSWGGRVLGVTALGNTLSIALERCYHSAAQLHFEGMHYRKDIGT
ncbi:phosphoribosylamine--glycine ligase [bacterium]|nr:phosphoribosylamine--glycine ligase [bacterium]